MFTSFREIRLAHYDFFFPSPVLELAPASQPEWEFTAWAVSQHGFAGKTRRDYFLDFQGACLHWLNFYCQLSSGKRTIIFKGQQVSRRIPALSLLEVPVCVRGGWWGGCMACVYFSTCKLLCPYLVDRTRALVCRHNDGCQSARLAVSCFVCCKEVKLICGTFWVGGQGMFTVNRRRTRRCKIPSSRGNLVSGQEHKKVGRSQLQKPTFRCLSGKYNLENCSSVKAQSYIQ